MHPMLKSWKKKYNSILNDKRAEGDFPSALFYYYIVTWGRIARVPQQTNDTAGTDCQILLSAPESSDPAASLILLMASSMRADVDISLTPATRVSHLLRGIRTRMALL